MTKLQVSSKKHNRILEFITSADHERRGVAFLILDDSKVTAKNEFDKLKKNTQRHFRKRFETWQIGLIKNDWYHGWDKSEFSGKYTKCFVFEYKSKNKGNRFYGFLCNPKDENPRYQLCVLINHIIKRQYKTQIAFLDIVETFRTTLKIQKKIKDFFKENQ